MGDFCNNCNRPISIFFVGAETKYVALDGKVGWDVYKTSLWTENLSSGLPFAHTNEAWEEAGETSAVSPFFPYIAHEVPHRPEICCAEGQRSSKMHFLFALWLVGSGRNRHLYQEWHEMRTASFQGADKLGAQQQCSTMHCYCCGEVQKIRFTADKIETTKRLRWITLFLPSSSKRWSLPSFKSSSTHGGDRGLLLVSLFSFSPLIFFSNAPIKTHIMAIKTGVREEKNAMTMETWRLPSKFSSFSRKREEENGRAEQQ